MYKVSEWTTIEREVLLCRQIRDANREFDSFWTKMKARLALKDNEATMDYFINIVKGERAIRKLYDELITKYSEVG